MEGEDEQGVGQIVVAGRENIPLLPMMSLRYARSAASTLVERHERVMNSPRLQVVIKTQEEAGRASNKPPRLLQ